MAIRGIHPGLNQTAGIGLKMFSDDELEKIHLATLDVLWNVGVKVESPQAVQIFDGSGCTFNKHSGIVKIPAHLVEDAIRSCPPTFRACGRDASKDFVCERDRVGFVNFGEAPRMIDPETRTLRKPKRKDVDQATRFLDALDQISVFERPLTPSDMNQNIACLYNIKSFFENCTKHGYIGINSVENLRTCYEMAKTVAGGADKFRERPIFSTTCDPISPLLHSQEACDILIESCNLGIPLKINAMGLAGGTTCVNLAGTLVTHNAEILSMMVLGQLVKKGHPMVYGTSTAIMDLKTALASIGCPELGLFSAAIAKLAQFYQMPTWVAGG
ncbi:MAG: trimethylamine methyltransferase family protein [Deltaproteobacteria bacterium]|nr:trimethylamine methyltransferase family protein [Deltaproteobacteria bacterium]MBW2632990.1 trimethylamine methyltransferase family protein [Deltaproteobacteria bacterium]MBW2677783.1 trimethylamine methyltransferase family protein [Deltaproteobacteria bacterium]